MFDSLTELTQQLDKFVKERHLKASGHELLKHLPLVGSGLQFDEADRRAGLAPGRLMPKDFRMLAIRSMYIASDVKSEKG